jgi:DNA-binding PadR family transcriptional regulator
LGGRGSSGGGSAPAPLPPAPAGGAEKQLRTDVVPGAVGAHLDPVEACLWKLEQRRDVVGRPNLAVLTLRESVGEDVGDQHKAARLTHRAALARALARIPGGSKEVRVCVTDIHPGDEARLQVPKDGPARQGVVDLADVAALSLSLQGAAILHNRRGAGNRAPSRYQDDSRGPGLTVGLFEVTIYRFDISDFELMSASSLDLAVLGLLKEGPMHGYEIRKRLTLQLGPLYAVSYGSLYPCLKRLGTSGMVQERPGEPKPRRRTKATKTTTRTARPPKRRARKVYEITPEGEALFFEQLEQGAVYDTDRFQARFAFFRYLPGEMRIRLLERRKAYLEDKLAEFKESLREARERMDAYSRSLIDHGVETTEQDIKWLSGLIDQERLAGAGAGAKTAKRARRRK